MKPFSLFTQVFLALALLVLIAVPVLGSQWGIGFGTERDARVLAALNDCAPEFRNAQGKCIKTYRSAGMRRSIFGGSYGSGK